MNKILELLGMSEEKASELGKIFEGKLMMTTLMTVMRPEIVQEINTALAISDKLGVTSPEDKKISDAFAYGYAMAVAMPASTKMLMEMIEQEVGAEKLAEVKNIVETDLVNMGKIPNPAPSKPVTEDEWYKNLFGNENQG